ncbi:LOW QUALITY PROTEIN: ABC transporter, ATP-binding protein [Geomicrobium sp. JCM 19038]|nr:LOW QUALITY PROTEIN: ABC transporter, ATP-binding protein [Geomicrobium sp. JCM 19038]
MSLMIKGVTKKYGSKVAVENLSFEVNRGEMFGLLGRNGAGKTTTFRLMLGLLKANQGTITWGNVTPVKLTSRTIGYLPEERGLYPKLNVMQQLIYLGRLKGMTKREVKDEVTKWLRQFEALQYENKRMEQLSKGNQQKIQFIASVMHKPELLILDEPFSGDPININVLKKAVFDLRDQGTTIVFSSHRMDHVESLCENLSILNNGQQVAYGSLQQIKAAYRSRTIRIKADFSLGYLLTLNGVIDVQEEAHETRVVVQTEAIVNAVFEALHNKGNVQLFAVEEPTLHDIFIDKAGSAHA